MPPLDEIDGLTNIVATVVNKIVAIIHYFQKKDQKLTHLQESS